MKNKIIAALAAGFVLAAVLFAAETKVPQLPDPNTVKKTLELTNTTGTTATKELDHAGTAQSFGNVESGSLRVTDGWTTSMGGTSIMNIAVPDYSMVRIGQWFTARGKIKPDSQTVSIVDTALKPYDVTLEVDRAPKVERKGDKWEITFPKDKGLPLVDDAYAAALEFGWMAAQLGTTREELVTLAETEQRKDVAALTRWYTDKMAKLKER